MGFLDRGHRASSPGRGAESRKVWMWGARGKPWEKHGKTTGKPWKNHGKTMGKPWKTMEDSMVSDQQEDGIF